MPTRRSSGPGPGLLAPRPALRCAALALAIAALAPASAPAATTWRRCAPARVECTRVSVALDRSGSVPGQVSLRVVRQRRGPAPTATAVMAIDGGPGSPATATRGDFARALAPALRTRDLLLFDERGTGRSGALACPEVDDPFVEAVPTAAACAARLGAARGFYRSVDSVEDIEAVRAAAGYERLVLYGVSYGTKVAELYAAAHPDRVEALVLDSVVPPDGPDAFNRSSLRATGAVVADECDSGRCRLVTRDAAADVRAVVRQLARRPLPAVVALFGERTPVLLDASLLLSVLQAGDFDSLLRGDMPAALRSVRRGDTAPLMRLLVRAVALDVFGRPRRQADDSSLNDTEFLARRCEDLAPPWDPRAGVAERRRQALVAARAIPGSERGGFPARAAYESDVLPLCLGWPPAGAPPAAPSAFAAVPALVLSGGGDLRTPTSDGAAMAARIPGARLIVARHSGHAVLFGDRAACGRRAIADLLAARPQRPCPAGAPAFAPAPVAPLRLRDVPGRTRAGRTLDAVRETLADAVRHAALDRPARLAEPGSLVPGLRAGSVLVTRSGYRVRGLVYVPGVAVTGVADRRSGRARFVVRGGAGAHGIVRFERGRIDAVLGGRRLRARGPLPGARQRPASKRGAASSARSAASALGYFVSRNGPLAWKPWL